MKKNVRKMGIFGTAAFFLCSAFLGVGLLSPNAVGADGLTTATTDLIGAKTSNVTLKAASACGDYTGLHLDVSDLSQDWNAEINATFTGTSSISYLLPNRCDLGTTLQGSYYNQANSFAIKNVSGETVLTYTIIGTGWDDIWTKCYMHDNVNNKYMTINAVWSPYGAYSGYKTLDPNTAAVNGDHVFDQKVLPKTGRTGDLTSKNTLDGRYDGTLTFEYNDTAKTMTVKTRVADLKDDTSDDVKGKEHDIIGNGQTVVVGVVEKVDLSSGYTISAQNGGAYGDSEDANYFDHTHSSDVVITDINGITTDGATVSVAEIAESISYDGEKVVDETNVIELSYGEYLNDFTHTAITTVENADGSKTLTLKTPVVNTFAYANNKEFKADETINVTYGNATKAYLVDVEEPTLTIDTDKLFKATNATVTSAQTKGEYAGVLINPTDVYTAKINGTFNGDSSVAYKPQAVNSNDGLQSPVQSSAYGVRIRNANGDEVLTVVSYYGSNGWLGSGGRTFVYNPNAADEKYYTVPTVSGTNAYATVEDMKAGNTLVTALYGGYSKATGIHYGWQNYYNLKTISTEVFFHYDETAKTVTVTVNTPQKLSGYHMTSGEIDSTFAPEDITNTPEYVTAGVVAADLSAGYTVELVDCFDGTDFVLKATGVYVSQINGRSVSEATISSDTGSVAVECVNGETVEDDKNVVNVIAGTAVEFEQTTTFGLKSLTTVVEETVAPEEINYMNVGAYDVTVGGKAYTVNVNSITTALDGTAMQSGAAVRTSTPYGLRFTMTVSAENKAFIDANVGENKAYTAVNYGMIIMPYAYVDQYGDVTAETLFGDDAVYTWDGKTESGTETATVLEMRSTQGLLKGDAAKDQDENTYYLLGAITSLKTENVTKKFIGVGYVEFTAADGEKEYKVVSLYDGYVEGGDNTANNVRSAYDVAKAAYEDVEVTDTVLKQWLYDNYLKNNGYVVA